MQQVSSYQFLSLCLSLSRTTTTSNMEALVLYQYRGNNEDAVRGDKMRLMMTMTMQSLSMMYHIILLCYIQCTNQRRVVDRHYGCWLLMYRVVGSTM
jgi:hypothetical protein